MDFATLAVIVLAGLAVGPLLAVPRGWHVPVVVGELVVGIILGRTGLGYLDASERHVLLPCRGRASGS